MNKFILLACLFMGLVWSCNESELITPGDEYINTLNDGDYVVDINGVFTKFSYTTGATSTATLSQINGASIDGQNISISLNQALSVGTYTQTQGASITISSAEGIYTNLDENGIALPFTVNLSVVNNSLGKVSGTFEGSVMNQVTGEIKTLTNGKFISILFDPINNPTSALKGDFNGTTIDFSQNAKAQGVTTAAVISGENANTVKTLSISTPGGIAVGTFTEADQMVISVNLGSSNNPSDVYTNYDATTDSYLPVTMNITNITLNENGGGTVIGTFSGTITKFANGVPGEEITITNGSIKVPIVN